MRKFITLLASLTLSISIVAVVLIFAIIASCGGEQTAEDSGNTAESATSMLVSAIRSIETTMDSVNVHIEEDPDGDGLYQIQYSYRDRAGVWGVSNAGRMRVMYEVAPDTMVTDWYAVFFSNIADVRPDTVSVDLALFGEFGMSFGSQVTVFIDGTLAWSSPNGEWYYMAHPDTMEMTP